MKKIIIGLAIAIALIGGSALLMKSPADDNTMQGMDSSSQQKPSQASNSAPVEANSVTIKDFAFGPAKIIVKKGTTVKWTNQDDAKHNVNITSGPEISDGPLLAKGETYEKAFNQVGTYSYICTPHPYMKATVEVIE